MAAIPASCLSMVFETTPFKVTLPLATMMWMDGFAPSAYLDSAEFLH